MTCNDIDTGRAFIIAIGAIGFVTLVGLLFFVLGYRSGQISQAIELQPCRHTKGWLTEFQGMNELRAMMSGEMTLEEYRHAPACRTVRTCLDCGKEVK